MKILPVWNYQKTGVDNSPTILLLHGFLGSGNDWHFLSSKLDSHYCLMPDLPGHGKTAIETDEYQETIATASASIIRLLDRLNINKCSLLGYSLGGRIALMTYFAYPDRFNKIILESAMPGIENHQERNTRLQLDKQLAEKISKIPIEEFIDQWYSLPLFQSLHQDQNRLAQLKQLRCQNDPDKIAKALDHFSVGRQPNLWKKLEQINIPLLYICGELDEKYLKVSGKIKDACPTCRLEVVLEAGHNVHFEQPEKYLKLIKDFL